LIVDKDPKDSGPADVSILREAAVWLDAGLI